MPTMFLALHITLGILSLIVFILTAVNGSLFGTVLLISGDFLLGFLPYCCFVVRDRQDRPMALLLYAVFGTLMTFFTGASVLSFLPIGKAWLQTQFLYPILPMLTGGACYFPAGTLICALFRRIFARRRKE